jgi:hypothetical protein
MSVDTELANSLLNKKYENESAGNIKDFNSDKIRTNIYPKPTPNVTFPPLSTPTSNKEVDWKFLAQERLQIITEFQDAKNAWWEAWKLEKERADRLEAKLFSYMSGFVEGVQEISGAIVPEVKHSISSPAQVNRKRANWPSVKAQLEKKFSLSESTKESTQENTQEAEDKGE